MTTNPPFLLASNGDRVAVSQGVVLRIMGLSAQSPGPKLRAAKPKHPPAAQVPPHDDDDAGRSPGMQPTFIQRFDDLDDRTSWLITFGIMAIMWAAASLWDRTVAVGGAFEDRTGKFTAVTGGGIRATTLLVGGDRAPMRHGWPVCNDAEARARMADTAYRKHVLAPLNLHRWIMPVTPAMMHNSTTCRAAIAAIEGGIPYPIVVRPLSRRNKRLNVVPPIANNKTGIDVDVYDDEVFCDVVQVIKVMQGMNMYPRDIIAEKTVNGPCYRVLVFRGQVLDVLLNAEPFVKGDGKSSLRTLIARRNEAQKKMGLYATHNVDYRSIDLYSRLQKKSVPNSGRKISITKKNSDDVKNGWPVHDSPVGVYGPHGLALPVSRAVV